MGVALAHGGDGCGDGELDRVGLPALGAQPLPLGGADRELLAGARILPGLTGLISLLGLLVPLGLAGLLVLLGPLGLPGATGLLGGRCRGRCRGLGVVWLGDGVLLGLVTHARESIRPGEAPPLSTARNRPRERTADCSSNPEQSGALCELVIFAAISRAPALLVYSATPCGTRRASSTSPSPGTVQYAHQRADPSPMFASTGRQR